MSIKYRPSLSQDEVQFLIGETLNIEQVFARGHRRPPSCT